MYILVSLTQLLLQSSRSLRTEHRWFFCYLTILPSFTIVFSFQSSFSPFSSFLLLTVFFHLLFNLFPSSSLPSWISPSSIAGLRKRSHSPSFQIAINISSFSIHLHVFNCHSLSSCISCPHPTNRWQRCHEQWKGQESIHFLPPSLPSCAVISMRGGSVKGDTQFLAGLLAVIVVVHMVHFSPESEWTMGTFSVHVPACSWRWPLLPCWGTMGPKVKMNMSRAPAPTLSQYSVSTCAHVLCVGFWASLWVWLTYEWMCVIALYLWGCPFLLCESEYVSLISRLTWCNKEGFCLSQGRENAGDTSADTRWGKEGEKRRGEEATWEHGRRREKKDRRNKKRSEDRLSCVLSRTIAHWKICWLRAFSSPPLCLCRE